MWPLVFSMCVLGTTLLMTIPLEGLLSTVLLLPLGAALFLCVLPGKESQLHRFYALFFSLVTLVLCMRLWSGFVPAAVEPFQQVVGFSRSWNGLLTVKLEFGLDSLSLWMVLLTAALMPLAVLCSWQTQNQHSQSFYALLLALESFLFRCFTSLDLLCFYVLYECALLPMFLLIGLGGSRARKVRAAYLLVLYTLVGSLAMLPCLLLLYSRAGTTNYLLLRQLPIDSRRQLLLWWGFFLAFAVKVPLMPLHLWLPEAHVERSTAGSVLLAGVLLKLGTYGLCRFNLYLFPEASAYLGPRVSTICLVGVIYRSLTTLRQVDLKKIVAYSSVAHMSLVVLALFTMNEVGILGSILTMLAHGIASPALFLCVGALYDRTHTKALKYLGGAATAMPLFSVWFFIFSLCNMALPLTPNFVGEFLSLCGIFAQNAVSLTICLGGVILSAVYTLWAYARVVHGMPKIQYVSGMADLNRREWWTLAILAIIAVWWGLKPTAVLDSLGVCVYYWQQCSLAIYEPSPWALLV
uniref:NADH-ubiquinone oxidoreductase chain 4 n=1 Tax=Pectinodesmus pectinatus TaxID=91197 RepID=A0A2H4E7D5_9CHLO|nr:NADH dehydrogenase subunit 4 [Pectinodesmus pectinatus]ANG44806.1 NADH dehydrogenase subunit 4 [Pectinodesmus pectinatus]